MTTTSPDTGDAAGSPAGAPTTAPAVRTEGLTKRFGQVTALDELDLEVRAGEVMAYLGPNGAGKTTTIRLLLGLLRPSAGRCEVFGLDATRRSVEAHRRLAYVPSEANLWPRLTGAETLHVLGQLHGQVDEEYRDLLIARFALDTARKVRAYSKGNRQKVLLIAALMTRADLLVLDEPTSGLDPLMEQAFRTCVHEAKARGQTVFLSSHILSEVEAVCDRVAILRDGRLVELGSLDDLRHLSTQSVDVTYAGTLPDLSDVPGVSGVHVDGHSARIQLCGPIGPLLHALVDTNSGAGVQTLRSREPSLEELFLGLYGGDGAR
jgi:ABC-2 type transport system ATP-binding protein